MLNEPNNPRNGIQHTSTKIIVDKDDPNLLIPGLIACTTVASILALTAPFIIGPLRSPLPYMATPSRKIHAALKFIKDRKQFEELSSIYSSSSSSSSSTNSFAGSTTDKNKNRTLTFVDLGSGDGDAVYQAVRLGYHRAIGIELNSTLYLISQFRRLLFWTSDERKRSTFLCQDFLKTAPPFLNVADAVMIFGVQALMPKISTLIAENCRPHTLLLAYRFPIPVCDDVDSASKFVKPNLATIDSSHGNVKLNVEVNRRGERMFVAAELIYDEEEMKIYSCSPRSNVNNTI